MDKWDDCGGVVNEYELEGRPCYAGLDLSSTSDLTAMVLVFPPRDEEEQYHVRSVSDVFHVASLIQEPVARFYLHPFQGKMQVVSVRRSVRPATGKRRMLSA